MGDADGLAKIAQGIFDGDLVALAAEEQADGGLIVGVLHPVVHGGEIEIHFPGEFGLEGFHLEIDHDIAAKAQVIEEEIDIVILSPDFEMDLTPDQREADAQFEQEFLDMFD